MNAYERAVIDAAREFDRVGEPARETLTAALDALDFHEKRQNIRSLMGRRVIIMEPDQRGSAVVSATVVDVQVTTDRIDVTTEERFIKTSKRDYVDGRTSVYMTLEVSE